MILALQIAGIVLLSTAVFFVVSAVVVGVIQGTANALRGDRGESE